MIVSNKIVIVCQGVGNHCPSALIKTGSTKERLHGIALSMGWARQGDNYYCPSCLITVTLMAEPASEPVSDPTPDLRGRIETIAGYHDPHDSEGVQWCRACGTCFPCVTRVEIDAILSTLGEPK